MGAEYLTMTGTGDHTVTVTLSGDAESLRPRLVRAVERLGYTVTSEQPILARRGATGGARWGCSWNALEYPARLTVGLRRQSANTTLVTFDYEIKNPFLTSGDKQTLQREAEAIAALATQRASETMCAACGTEATDDSRFCRRCGAVVVSDIAELEILRLTNGARSGHQQIVGGAFTLLAMLLIVSLLLLLSSAPLRVVSPVMIIGGLIGLLMLFSGLWRTHRTLNPKEEKRPQTLPAARSAPVSFGTLDSSPLLLEQPPHRVPMSVTEGTTELLERQSPRRAQSSTVEQSTDNLA